MSARQRSSARQSSASLRPLSLVVGSMKTVPEIGFSEGSLMSAETVALASVRTMTMSCGGAVCTRF